MESLLVFCGSSFGVKSEYREAAREMGRLLSSRRIRLVYGGGRVGLMGALADAALEGGGEVVGVIPEALEAREVAHRGLTRLEVVATMHERKARMAELCDAVTALPGGYGTMDELFEAWTWAQLGIHQKPIGLLDAGGYFQPWLAAMDHAVREGFVSPAHRALVIAAARPEALLDRLEAARRERGVPRP
jgi:uncharacterized protein (TIGR00730 family)